MARATLRRSDWTDFKPDLTRIPTYPSTYVFIHHSVTDQASTLEEFKQQLVQIESDHVYSEGWKAIAYNKLVTHKGLKADGRGWGVEGGATGGWADDQGISICALGNYHNRDRVTSKLKNAVADIIAEGIVEGHLVPQAQLKVRGHRERPFATACPGDSFMESLKDINARVSKKVKRLNARKRREERIKNITKRIKVLRERRSKLREELKKG